jgi:hypothetical protein
MKAQEKVYNFLSIEFEESFPKVEPFILKTLAKYPTLTGRFIFGFCNRRFALGSPIYFKAKCNSEGFNSSPDLFHGVCWKRGLVICKVNINAKSHLPYLIECPIKSKSIISQAGFEWIWDCEGVQTLDEMLVWVFGHELWHRLCYLRLEKGNFQTRANAFGFSRLRAFKNNF